MKTTTLSLKLPMQHSLLQRSRFLIPLVLACFALSPHARATCQEGCLASQNTVLGEDAFLSNTAGTDNTALGFDALYNNINGVNNTAVGSSTLFSNNGFDNTAVGYQALLSNTTGFLNTATGSYTLHSNTTGVQNTASGNGALTSNTIGSYNTANGNGALTYNTTGNFNTALGNNALLYNTIGGNNIAVGPSAGSNLTTGSYNIDIGHHGLHGETGTIRIGKQGIQTTTFIAGINGATIANGLAVIVGSNGQLGTVVSSGRFKDAIKPMDRASEAILALNPVTFRYKHEVDQDGVPQFGLVAEDVEKVNPDLVVRDGEGKPYTVRYEAVNTMLLNEFLKEHRRVEQQTRINQEQQARIGRLEAALKEQAGKIQKVSAQLKTRKSSGEIVLNNRYGAIRTTESK